MEYVTSRFGVRFEPNPEAMGELGQIARDYRELGSKVVADRLRAAMLEQTVSAVSDYTQES